MSATKKKYDIGGVSSTRRQVVALPVVRTIKPETKLVSIADASRLLKLEKGLDMTAWTIARRCSTGQWAKGVFWVKPLRQYLINLEAVYEAIAAGEAL